MAKSETMHFRIDEDTKNEAQLILEELGLNISTAINMYLKQIVLHKEIPFRVSIYPQLNVETLAALEEAEFISRDPRAKSYSSFAEILTEAKVDLAHE